MGIFGNNRVAEFHAVPGDMIGLWGRKDMEELETNLYLRKGSARADFETLGIYDQELERLPNKHAAIDFLKFDVHSLGDESYKEFRCEQASMAALTADAASTRPRLRHPGECLVNRPVPLPSRHPGCIPVAARTWRRTG